MLYAGNQISPRCKHIGQKGILGIFNRIALADNCERKRLVANAGFDLVVPPDREIDGNRTLAFRVKKVQRLMS